MWGGAKWEKAPKSGLYLYTLAFHEMNYLLDKSVGEWDAAHTAR